MAPYYRLTSYTTKSGAEQAMVSLADQMRDQIRGMLTANSIEVVRIGENQYVTIAVYKDEASAEKGARTARAIYAQMGDIIDMESMEISTGPLIWKL